MKATINADGLLTVSPDNEIEAYALRQWLTSWKLAAMTDDSVTTSALCIAWDALDDTDT